MTASIDEVLPTNVGTKVVQVTNIAPQATRDQMSALFGYIGKIEDIRLYPTMRDVSLAVQSRICYVKYFDPACVGVAQHLTNTVFIDRAVIVTPYTMGEIPDEYRALDIAAQANVIPGLYPSDPKLPPHIVNQIEGIAPNQVITTHDPMLVSNGLPLYPPLPINYDTKRIEEIRRTLLCINVDESITGEQLVDFFQKAGDVKYVRFCTRDNDPNRYALVEFSEQSSVIPGLKLNGSELNGKRIQVYHSTQAIAKPVAKSNEAAQREIEEAMTRVKEAQSMISAAIDPVIGILSKDKKRSRSASRSRRRSRSRSRHRRRSHSRRSHSRRTRSPRRSHSRSSRSRTSRRRSRSKRRSKSKDDHRARSRDRRRSRSRKSRDRERDRDRNRDRKRTRSREEYSRSHRHKSKERVRSKSRSRGRSYSRRPSKSKNSRDARDHSRSRTKDKERRSSKKRSDRHSSSKEVSGRHGSSTHKRSKREEFKSPTPSKRRSRSSSKRKSKSPKRKSHVKSRSSSKQISPSPSKRMSRSLSRRKSRSSSKRKSRSLTRSPKHDHYRDSPARKSRSRDESISPVAVRSKKKRSNSWRESRSRS